MKRLIFLALIMLPLSACAETPKGVPLAQAPYVNAALRDIPPPPSGHQYSNYSINGNGVSVTVTPKGQAPSLPGSASPTSPASSCRNPDGSVPYGPCMQPWTPLSGFRRSSDLGPCFGCGWSPRRPSWGMVLGFQ